MAAIQHSIKTRFLYVTVALSTLFWTPVLGENEVKVHPVFSKYPSPEELNRAVAEFKQEHLAEYRAALEDFVVAVRSNLKVEWPRFGPRPKVIPKWPLRLPELRPYREMLLAATERKREDGDELWIAFYQEHIDSLTVEYAPAVRMVALDVLLNGLEEWSDWDSDRLKGYRERYPDIYRIAAANVLYGYDLHDSQRRYAEGDKEPFTRALDAGGIYLKMLYDPGISNELRREIRRPLRNIQHRREALDYLIERDLEIEDPVRRPATGIIQSLSRRLGNEERREYWLPYLNHPDTSLRRMAVIEIGQTRTRPRDVPPEMHPDWELIQLLRAIAEDDPDKTVRDQANYALKWRLLDDRPPRGHVTYDKEQK